MEQGIGLHHQINPMLFYSYGLRLHEKSATGEAIYQNTPDVDTEVISYHLGKFATVFHAEMFGIEREDRRLLETGSTGKDIHILTDNQACPKSL